MNRRRIAIALLALAVLGPLGGLIWFESNLEERLSRRPEVGTVFPSLPGLADGEFLPVVPGRLRVVVFAKAGCGNCDRTISALRRLAADGEIDFDLIAVVADAGTAGLKDTAGLYSIADPDGSLSKRFGVVHVPLVFLVDGDSRIRDTTAGERPDSAWRSFLDLEAGCALTGRARCAVGGWPPPGSSSPAAWRPSRYAPSGRPWTASPGQPPSTRRRRRRATWFGNRSAPTAARPRSR